MIPVLTTNDFPGMRIVHVIGTVYGSSIRSRNVFGNFLGNVRAVFGGNQAGYRNMIAQTREDAMAQLAAGAEAIGANAVIAMRFDSGEFGAGQGLAMNEVTAYGTAVIVQEVEK